MLKQCSDCLGATVRKAAWNSNRRPRFPKVNLNIYRRVSQVNLMLPCEQSREPQRAEGAPRNTPPKSSWLSPIVGTRESPGRMRRMVEVGRGEPYENSIPSWEVGRGKVVGARESRVHQDED